LLVAACESPAVLIDVELADRFEEITLTVCKGGCAAQQDCAPIKKLPIGEQRPLVAIFLEAPRQLYALSWGVTCGARAAAFESYLNLDLTVEPLPLELAVRITCTELQASNCNEQTVCERCVPP
jgi:hypothetical protein